MLAVVVQGFALICTFVLVILFTQLQYGARTFMCNDRVYNVYKFVYSCCLRMYNCVIVVVLCRSIWMFLSEINYQSIL